MSLVDISPILKSHSVVVFSGEFILTVSPIV